jgi:hypothetical protein
VNKENWPICRNYSSKHDFRNKNSDFASPPGFNLSAGQSHSEVARDTDQSQLIIKKSWDCALGPVKGVSCFFLM